MMRIKKYTIYLLFFIGSMILLHGEVLGGSWKQEKGKHFIVEYAPAVDTAWIKQVLREAEKYYSQSITQIGYTRYSDFWTWENRVKIIIYLNKETFVRESGQPAWSRGSVRHTNENIYARKIISYKQETGFLNGVLPHEIGHLILRDFVGPKYKIPVWFDEGVAQLNEQGKKAKAHAMMRAMIRQNHYVSLKTLAYRDVRQEKDAQKVSAFYAQSVSVVDFLITKHGVKKFGKLCNYMKEGEDFNTALRNAYPSSIRSMEEMEERWVSYMRGL